MAYIVSLKQFDGPLDLLLTLISRARIDIREIFVSQITEQYLEAMAGVDELDMDIASEFLQMAATLLEVKSRALLPTPPKEVEGEESPEDALIRQLTEYKAFKELSAQMRSLEEDAKRAFSKLPEEFPLPPPVFELTGLTLQRLQAAFTRVLARAASEQEEQDESAREIAREVHTVQSCMFRITSKLREGAVRFDDLFSEKPRREEVVAMFIAVLELLRLSRISVRQSGLYGDIKLQARKPAKQTGTEG